MRKAKDEIIKVTKEAGFSDHDISAVMILYNQFLLTMAGYLGTPDTDIYAAIANKHGEPFTAEMAAALTEIVETLVLA